MWQRLSALLKINPKLVVGTVLAAVFIFAAVIAQGDSGDEQVITIKPGDSISYLCFKLYGQYDAALAAKIKAFNPQLADINAIYVGQKIRFPKLSVLTAPPPPEPEPEAPSVTAEKPAPEPEPPQDRLEPKDAYITYLSGKVSVRYANTQKFKPVRVNASLKQGDTLRTGKKTRAEIITFDNDIIRLAPNTELTINYLQHNPVKQIKKKGLFLSVGKMWNKAKSLFNSKSEYTVKTPNAISGIRGTAFNIQVSDQDTTRIKTYSGAVNVWRLTPKPADQHSWQLSEPVVVEGPKSVTMREWTEILLKINEELMITRHGATKKSFDPQYDETHDEWIRWNKTRDAEFERSAP